MKICLQFQCRQRAAASSVTAPLVLWAPPCLGMSPHWPQSTHKPVLLYFSLSWQQTTVLWFTYVWVHCLVNNLNTKTPSGFCWVSRCNGKAPILDFPKMLLGMMCLINLIFAYHLPHLSIHGQSISEYTFNIPLNDGWSSVWGWKCPTAKETTEIFCPGEFAVLTKTICVQVKEEVRTADALLQSRSSD